MTGYQSKKTAALDKLLDDDDIQVYKRPWVSLTEADLKPICDKWRIIYGSWADDFARDIEAKLREKNSA